jgi:hypothetical protein
MATDAHDVHVQRVDIERHLANGLRCIGVKEHFVLAAQLSYFLHRLDHPNLVVHSHDADQDCVRPNGRLRSVQRR